MPLAPRALFAGLVDDAALFPPGNAAMDVGLREHAQHLASSYGDVIGPFLCPVSRIDELTAALDDDAHLDLSLVVDVTGEATHHALRAAGSDPRLSLVGIEAAHRRLADDAAVVGENLRRLPATTGFLELPRSRFDDSLDLVAKGGWRAAKYRTGGTSADAFPDADELAAFLVACAGRELPFKLTAGLHHAIRNTDPHTGFEQHGVLNVLVATRAAHAGKDVDTVGHVLEERDADALLAAVASWSEGDAIEVRHLFQSFGCCGVTDPIDDLIGLGVLDGGKLVTGWLDIPEDSPFPVQNLPYGAFSHADEAPRVGVALGDFVIDLAPLAAGAGLDGGHVFEAINLNAFMALGRPAWSAVRSWLTELLTHPAERGLVESHLIEAAEVTMHLPFEVADYVDFYSSQHHAENVGRIFRPDAEALTPNWKHLPVGYHGRAGTVVVSGTDIVRPSGQRKPPADAAPTYGPSGRLDIEAEVGFVVGTPSTRGTAVPTDAFRDHVFGVCLVNDWSARDIQAWEYVPLGPFLGKSFATSVSPWVVPLDALDAARLAAPRQDPAVLPYLRDSEGWGLDLALEVTWNGSVVSRPPFAGMYWTAAQQLAHLTVNGASLRTGDLFASGTVSGADRDQRGSFLELSWNGAEPVTLDDGSTRTFLEDGDVVSISATAPGADGVRLGFGSVTGRVQPAPPG